MEKKDALHITFATLGFLVACHAIEGIIYLDRFYFQINRRVAWLAAASIVFSAIKLWPHLVKYRALRGITAFLCFESFLKLGLVYWEWPLRFSHGTLYSIGFALNLCITLYVLLILLPRRVSLGITLLATLLSSSYAIFMTYGNSYFNSVSFYRHPKHQYDRYDKTLTRSMALRDLKTAVNQLKKLHPYCIHGLPPDTAQAYALALQAINQAPTITINRLKRVIESVFATLHDEHTFVNTFYSNDQRLKASANWRISGYRIVELNGTTFSDLVERYHRFYSFTAKGWLQRWLQRDLTTFSGLDYLGLTLQEPMIYKITKDGKKILTVEARSEDFVDNRTFKNYLTKLQTSERSPSNSVCYHHYDAKHQTMILTLNSCEATAAYRQLLHNCFSDIKRHQATKLIVDLRNNSGGNARAVNEFFRYLPLKSFRRSAKMQQRILWWLTEHLIYEIEPIPGFYIIAGRRCEIPNYTFDDLAFHGPVYLLTSADTFSAGMMFADQIQASQAGQIVGEPPGEPATSCGESPGFILPNSKLFMQISTKIFWRADPKNSSLLVEPDIPCNAADALAIALEL